MRKWVLVAGLMLAAAIAPRAFAADLDDGEPPPPPGWKGGAYGYPPKGLPPPPGYYEDDEDDRPSYSKKYSDDDPRYPPYRKYGDDDDGAPPYKKYSDAPHFKGSCVRSEQVRDRLTSMGWGDFHAGKAISPSTVKLRARRPSGRLFELRLDRCSGTILEARPVELHPLQPYYGFKSPDGYKGSDRPYWGPYGSYGAPGYWGPYAGRPYGYGKRPPNWDD